MDSSTAAGSVFLAFGVMSGLVRAILLIGFAAAVNRDIKRLQAHSREPVLVSAGLWVLATLAGGVIAAGVYWIVHHALWRDPSTGRLGLYDGANIRQEPQGNDPTT